MEESGDGYNIRFRHVCGDFGPFLFPKASTVWTLKEKLLEEWAKGKKGQKKIRKRVVCVGGDLSFHKGSYSLLRFFFFTRSFSLTLPGYVPLFCFVLFLLLLLLFCSNNNDYVILMLLLLLVVQWR